MFCWRCFLSFFSSFHKLTWAISEQATLWVQHDRNQTRRSDWINALIFYSWSFLLFSPHQTVQGDDLVKMWTLKAVQVINTHRSQMNGWQKERRDAYKWGGDQLFIWYKLWCDISLGKWLKFAWRKRFRDWKGLKPRRPAAVQKNGDSGEITQIRLVMQTIQDASQSIQKTTWQHQQNQCIVKWIWSHMGQWGHLQL